MVHSASCTLSLFTIKKYNHAQFYTEKPSYNPNKCTMVWFFVLARSRCTIFLNTNKYTDNTILKIAMPHTLLINPSIVYFNPDRQQKSHTVKFSNFYSLFCNGVIRRPIIHIFQVTEQQSGTCECLHKYLFFLVKSKVCTRPKEPRKTASFKI